MLRSTYARSFAAVLLATVGAVGCATAQSKGPNTSSTPMMAAAEMSTTTGAFKGVKVNGGTVSLLHQDGKIVLTYSDDFKIPDTPAPHWQVVDSKGNVYLLQRLKIKGDKENKTIVLPSYIKDVAKVQIWCAYAEVLLGEASFNSPQM